MTRPAGGRSVMAKFFAVTLLVITILSAVPIVRNTWHPMEDISTHGPAIDDQLSETMWEAGLSFLASQILLAWLIWKFSGNRPAQKSKSFPGGAAGLVAAAFLLVGLEVFALGIFGIKSWAILSTFPRCECIKILSPDWTCNFISLQPRSANTKLSAVSSADLATTT